MRTKTSGIYKIRNLLDDKIYVGSSISIEQRWQQHKQQLRKNKHHSKYLQNAWNKYGAESFFIETIEDLTFLITDSKETIKEKLLEREQYYIDTFKPQYNGCPKAGSRLGSKASEETKAKMSASMKGKNTYPRSEETKQKLREINLNMSDETKQKMSLAKLGTTVSEETKKRMSKAQRGKPKSAEHIEKSIRSKTIKRLEEINSNIVKKEILIKNDVRHMLRKFSNEDIRFIRSCELSDRQLGFKFNCSGVTIKKIRSYITYKDV
jgi:group I intron endonuclease